MASAADEDRAPTFSTDETPDPTTPLLTREVIEEEIHTVKRTITTEYAQTASPETPTRQRTNRGFSSPLSTPKYHGRHTAAVLTTPLKSERFHATPENKGKYSTPSSVGTQDTPFSTPQMNRFTQAPFTQADRVVTPPMPPLTQPRRMPIPMPSSTQPCTPQTPIHQFLKYYPILHPTELESFMSRYFYVVTVGQDVGIFATWYANPFSFGITANCSRDEANSRITGVTGSSHSKCKNWQDAFQIYSKAYTEGRIRRIPVAGGVFDNPIILDSPNSNGEWNDEYEASATVHNC
jgi:hypothetical protein